MSDEERVAIMEMKEDIAGIKATLQTMAETNRLAIEAFQSARSAHHRIDTLKTDTEKDMKSLADNLKWLWGAAIAAIGLAVTIGSKVIG